MRATKPISTLLSMLFLALLTLLFSTTSFASGLLKPINSQDQDLKILTHHVNVVIEDSYATTQIEQEFFNPNDHQLEALYTFPVPRHAVVGEFIYWINGKPVIAEAVAKEKARAIYEDQKSQGRNTALTEKDEYRHFEMRVFPVLPQQSVKIRLVYLQDALLDHGVGRYVYPMEEGGVDEQAQSFWQRNDVVEQAFSFNLDLKSSYPVDRVRLPAHPQATLTQRDTSQWQASLTSQTTQLVSGDESNGSTAAVTTGFKLNQDVVFYWRLQDGLPGRVDMVSYRDPTRSERGTFKLTFTPGDDLAAVTQGRDWVFVLDKSGSMRGKFATLVEGVRMGLNKLPASDRFRIVLFNNNAYELTNGYLSASPDNIQRVMDQLANIQPDQGTNLYEGLDTGLLQLDRDRATGLVLVTDGVANVGLTAKKEFLDLIRRFDVRLYTFILGNSANLPLLEPMTQVSGGFSAAVSNADDLMGHLMNIGSKLTHQAYRDIELDIDGVKVADLTPQQFVSLYRGEQLAVFGHYFKPGEAKVTLKMKVDGETRRYHTIVTLPAQADRNPELERLWAFSAIRDLENQMDYLESKDADSEQAIESLALEYGLLTDYTSLIVTEEGVLEGMGFSRNNQQRVEREQQAREQRQQQIALRPTRVDNSQPMFNSPSPSHSRGSGGGSLNLWLVSLLLGCAVWRHRSRRS
ncbi:VIT and vWA domain-containing protein [Vibrio fluvialis]